MYDSPLARGIRTFAALMVGPLTAAAAVNWFGGDATLGATKLTLAIIAAVVAGVAAWAIAQSGRAPATPLGRAIATFLEGLAAGLATIGLTDLTGVAAIEFASTAGGVVLSAFLGALVSLAHAAATQTTQTPAP